MQLTSRQWALIIGTATGAMVLNIIFFQIVIVSILCGALTGHSAFKMIEAGNRPRAIAASKPLEIDGKTQQEWYDLVKAMGKTDFERMSRPALNGLDDDPDGIGGWDVKALLGDSLYKKIQREWYPDEFCTYCDERGCKEKCDEAFYHKSRAGMTKRDRSLYLKYQGYNDYDDYKYYELKKWKQSYYLD